MLTEEISHSSVANDTEIVFTVFLSSMYEPLWHKVLHPLSTRHCQKVNLLLSIVTAFWSRVSLVITNPDAWMKDNSGY